MTTTFAPEWFTRAIEAPWESRFVDVLGCLIHYGFWGHRGGDPKRPGLLFVPASGGHVHWFAHVAPFLADQFNVAVIDLAGCGDSGRRDAYSRETMTAEMMAVCADAGMLDAAVPPTIVGHSAGAQYAVRAAMTHDEALLGVIAIDGLRYDEALARDHAIKILTGPRPAPRTPRVYDSLEEAVARFKLTPVPLTPVANDFIVKHIGQHSFRPVEGGWTSKYDPAQGGTVTLAFELKDVLKDLKCRAASLYAEHTHLADETVGDRMTELNDGRVTVFVIPGTNHYIPIDNPFAFVAAIKGIVLTWISDRRTKSC